jgi:ankyrin repeat protein
MDNLKRSFNQPPAPSREESDGFIRAAAQGNNAAVQAFLDKYPTFVDIREINSFSGRTALMAAAESGRLSTIKLLLKNGADVKKEIESSVYFTATFIAASHGHSEAIALLAQNGAKINAALPNSGTTPLMTAIWFGNDITVLTLVQNGASVLQKDKNGKTALMHAQEQLSSLLKDTSLQKEFKRGMIERKTRIVSLLEEAERHVKAKPPRRFDI